MVLKNVAMSLLPGQLIQLIHEAPGQLLLALNGGSRALAELLEVPGGSRTLLEAAIPYSDAALAAWLGSRPEQSCSARTARAMAVAAFGRALRYGAAEATAAGVASSASLASDRPKRGEHRAHVALQTAGRTACWSLVLKKGARSRGDEEQLISRIVLNAIADACGIAARLELPLLDGEHIEVEQVAAPPDWQALFLGRAEAIRARSTGFSRNAIESPEGGTTSAPPVVFSGAFNPLHVGHRRMAEIAAEMLGRTVEWEISILNVDKPALDYVEVERRLMQFPLEQTVWLTRAATFDEKSRLFPGAVFVVGIDTLQRIADPRYYGHDRGLMLQTIQRLLDRSCRFFVFGRSMAAEFLHLGHLDLPEELRAACSEVPPEAFREDVSSTALRGQSSGA
jgi:hypothetical protein